MGALVLLILTSLLMPISAFAQGSVPLVATERVEPVSYEVTLPAKIGLLRAGEHRSLAFEVTGRLISILEEGRAVAAGELLAQLDAALEQAQLRGSELRLRQARTELERIEGLRRSNAASSKALEAAETAVALGRSDRDVARERLSRRRLVAPFDGIVARTFNDPGEIAGPGVPVAELIDVTTLRLEVGVPAYQVVEIPQGTRAIVTIPALPGMTLEGVVHRIAAAAAEGDHLFEVEIRVSNPNGRLRPGMSARARILTETLPSVLVAPLGAVVERSGDPMVFFVEDGRAHAVSVTDGSIHGDRILLSSSIPFRELIVRGQRGLRDGSAVRVDNTVLGGTGEL